MPIALLAALAFISERAPEARRHPFAGPLVEAAFAGGSVAFTGAGVSPMLPYLLVPGLALGISGTWRQVGAASAASVVGLGPAGPWRP